MDTSQDDVAEAQVRALIQRARQGNTSAFNQLIELHQRLVYSVALRMMGNPEEAEDITQEALITAYRALNTYRNGSFRVWLVRIVSNRCIDALRSRKRHLHISLDEVTSDDDNAAAFELPDLRDEPLARLEQQEFIAMLRQGLLTLQEEQRIAVILCDVEGFSYEEISQITHVPAGTVKSRIARGRMSLRAYILRQQELSDHPIRHYTDSPAQHGIEREDKR